MTLKICNKEKSVADNKLIAHIKTGESSDVHLSLETEYGVFENDRVHDDFERALVDLKKILPKPLKIQACISCQFSHYSPFGNGMFGDLKCFKNFKQEVKRLQDKTDLFELWDKGYQANNIFDVQETFDCQEHQQLTKNDWAYKDWLS